MPSPPVSLPVLVVAEDDKDGREALIEYIHDCFPGQLIILEAPDGKSALKLCQENEVAALVTDYIMMGMGGLTLCVSLREDSRTRKIPVAFLTGRVGDATLEEAQRRQGLDVFFKPGGVHGVLLWLQKHIPSLKAQFHLDS